MSLDDVDSDEEASGEEPSKEAPEPRQTAQSQVEVRSDEHKTSSPAPAAAPLSSAPAPAPAPAPVMDSVELEWLERVGGDAERARACVRAHDLLMRPPPLTEPCPIDACTSTVMFYDGTAEGDVERFADYDSGPHRRMLTKRLKRKSGEQLRVLDLGCGIGRDLRAFAEEGFEAIGLDASTRVCEEARKFSGCEVWEQDMLRLNLPAGRFHAVFAHAALYHLPWREMPRVLREVKRSLRFRGYLMCVNPTGRGVKDYGPSWQESRDLFAIGDSFDQEGRLRSFQPEQRWAQALDDAGYEIVERSEITTCNYHYTALLCR